MNRYKIKFIIVAIAGGICLIMILVSWRSKVQAVNRYRQIINQWNNNIVNLKIDPTFENIFSLQREGEWIVERERELKQLLLNRRIPSHELTPLQFKEELLSTQTKLKQLASIQGSKLQEDLGFQEYTAGQIPQQGEVVLLAKHLVIINELVNLLLRHRVSEINSITRLPDSSATLDSGGILYKEMALQIALCCTTEDLLGILQDIINVPYILVVRNLKINKLDEVRVSVEMLIGVCEYMG